MLRGEAPPADQARAFEVAMILHAEHEMNASTFTARVVAGTNADMHSAIVAAICALKGPLHGGANQAAMEMLATFGSPDRVADGVRERLERIHGDKWYKKGLPDEVFKRLVAAKEREKSIDWYEGQYQEIIDYAVFADLIEILEHSPQTFPAFMGLARARPCSMRVSSSST